MIPIRSSYQLGLLLVASAIAAGNPEAIAQPFPSNPIRIVVGSTPGSPPDIISRILASELGESEGWRVVVENKPGAIYTIAGSDVLKQPADGHTIFAVPMPAAVAPALMPKARFNLEADFAPVIQFSRSYNVLVVHPSVPAKTLSELVAHLKSNPDKLSFGSGGFGTPAHMVGELFKQQTGVRATHVPYPGAIAKAVADLLSGTIEFAFASSLAVVGHVEAGKLRALAVTGPHRIAALKDVPTVVEQGFPNLVVPDWAGFTVKSGTPDEIVARLNMAMNNSLAKDKVREALAKIGAEPVGGTPAEFGKLLKTEIARWSKVVKDAGLKLQK
jgi:tripartite-type tricarboxylate transporter receptor subunit TctC